MTILETIRKPEQIKELNAEQLTELAGEIRACILKVTKENGGHLASNLGVVELTLALHLVYDCPKDKLLFDVGHQCYAHKLLTGRWEQFHTLRQKDGLSGFPRMEESEYDAFGAGHSGTAISAALGYARARTAMGQNSNVAAVVGDGSFMNGPCVEAFNDAGHSGEAMVVVLNDNEMSIDRNVGALSRYLANMRTKPGYLRAKARTKSMLDDLPLVGGHIKSFVQGLKRRLRKLLVDGEFFEDLGFSYLGPVDGHDLPLLVNTFKAAKEMGKPVLVHVRTVKGKGYEPAQIQPELYHGVSPEGTQKAFSYTQAVGETLCALGKKDERLCVITAAMRYGTGAYHFAKRYPDRFYDVGIAESHAVTMAAAMAAGGMHPYFLVYSTFLQRSYDQLLHDVAIQKLPIRLLVSHFGLVGEDGATHNGGYALSYLLHVPGIRVLCPMDGRELRYLLQWANDHVREPFAILYGKQGTDGETPPAAMEWTIWPKLREGGQAALLCVGEMVDAGLRAAQLLKEKGIEVSVYNARQLKPLPEKELSALMHLPIVTIEENCLSGGFGSEVLRTLNERGQKTRLMNLGLPDRPIAHASRWQQLEECGLTPESIAEKVYSFVREEA